MRAADIVEMSQEEDHSSRLHIVEAKAFSPAESSLQLQFCNLSGIPTSERVMANGPRSAPFLLFHTEFEESGKDHVRFRDGFSARSDDGRTTNCSCGHG